MKLSRRRITFQLTPLLDLLLIVIFAQFMEMQRTTDTQAEEIVQHANVQETRAEELLRKLRQADRELAAAGEQAWFLGEVVSADGSAERVNLTGP